MARRIDYFFSAVLPWGYMGRAGFQEVVKEQGWGGPQGWHGWYWQGPDGPPHWGHHYMMNGYRGHHGMHNGMHGW